MEKQTTITTQEEMNQDRAAWNRNFAENLDKIVNIFNQYIEIIEDKSKNNDMVGFLQTIKNFKKDVLGVLKTIQSENFDFKEFDLMDSKHQECIFKFESLKESEIMKKCIHFISLLNPNELAILNFQNTVVFEYLEKNENNLKDSFPKIMGFYNLIYKNTLQENKTNNLHDYLAVFKNNLRDLEQQLKVHEIDSDCFKKFILSLSKDSEMDKIINKHVMIWIFEIICKNYEIKEVIEFNQIIKKTKLVGCSDIFSIIEKNIFTSSLDIEKGKEYLAYLINNKVLKIKKYVTFKLFTRLIFEPLKEFNGKISFYKNKYHNLDKVLDFSCPFEFSDYITTFNYEFNEMLLDKLKEKQKIVTTDFNTCLDESFMLTDNFVRCLCQSHGRFLSAKNVFSDKRKDSRDKDMFQVFLYLLGNCYKKDDINKFFDKIQKTYFHELRTNLGGIIFWESFRESFVKHFQPYFDAQLHQYELQNQAIQQPNTKMAEENIQTQNKLKENKLDVEGSLLDHFFIKKLQKNFSEEDKKGDQLLNKRKPETPLYNLEHHPNYIEIKNSDSEENLNSPKNELKKVTKTKMDNIFD